MLHFLGFILLIIGGVMLVPVPVSLIFNEGNLIPFFVAPALISIGLGFLLRKRFGPTELTLGKAMVMVTFAWILFSAFSSVPYVCGNQMSVEDAYFESMSGFTTTGLSMIPGDPIASYLVISEVGIFTPPDNEFIELYNPTDSDIDLKNLRGGGENLTFWVVYENGDASSLNINWTNTVVPAHGYFLLTSGSGDNITIDATFSARFENSGGVIIDDDSDPCGEWIDKVGWGSGSVENATEGVKISDNLAAGDSLERKAWGISSTERMRGPDSRKGNGYDTNNNAGDFVVHRGFRSPQNSSSAREMPVQNVEACPRTILFWRSLTQWVGGIGVIVLVLAALVGFGKAARKMYIAEARTEHVEPSIRETARSIGKIYVLFTILGIVGLCFAGSSLFEAVNHSMTGISTGGFSVRNTSFEGYGSPVLAVTILILVMGATSFAIHLKVMRGKWRELFKSVEVRVMILLIILSTLILVWFVGLQDAIFQSAAASTTTGFSSTNIAALGDAPKGVLTGLMFVGGGYGASSGAIKIIRTVIIIGAIYWLIKRSFLPDRAVLPMKISGRIYTEREIMETAIYAFIYVIVLIGGAVVLMLLGNSTVDSIFESTSAQGNVGLSVGITSTAMPLAGKISMTVQMLIGRLEIIPVIAFLSYLVARVPRPRRKPV